MSVVVAVPGPDDYTQLRDEVSRLEKERNEIIENIRALAKELDELDAKNVQAIIHVDSQVSLSKIPKEKMENLKRLKVTDACFTREDFDFIKIMKDLEWFTISRCSGNIDLDVVALLTKMEHLDISSSSCVHSWSALRNMKNLTHVYLDGAAINDNDISGLTASPGICELSIVGCTRITDISPLGALKELEVINANACTELKTIGTVGALSDLKELCLCHTAVDDAAIKDIGMSRGLFKLDLEGCSAVRDFSPLGDVLTLSMLSLCRCCPLVLPLFSSLPLLEFLNLDDALLNDSSIEEIAFCCGLRLLSVERCINVTDLSPLCRVITLEEIRATQCSQLQNMNGFGNLPVLKRLCLSCTNICETSLFDISKSSSLAFIDIRQCSISDLALKEIVKIKSLAALHMNDWIDVAGPISETMSRLKYISVSGPLINNDFLKSLAEANKIISLSLTDCQNVSDLTSLGNISSLMELTLAHCDQLGDITDFLSVSLLNKLVLEGSFVSDEMIIQLGASKTLLELSLLCCRRLTLLGALEAVQTLEGLTLAFCDHLKDITSIRHVKSLRSLILTHVDIPVQGIEDIGNSIALRHLHIDNFHKPIMLRSLFCMNVRDIYISNCAEVLVTACGPLDRPSKCILIENTYIDPAEKEKLLQMGIALKK